MKNIEIAKIFERIADALEIKGENKFKIIAYRNAAKALSDLTEDISEIYEKGKLLEIPGIGEGIAKKIEEYLKTGRMKKYEEAVSGIPEGLFELLNIPNLGPKTIKLAYESLKVENLQQLLEVINNGSLEKLPMMGKKKVENIKEGIKEYLEKKGEKRRFPIGVVEKVVEYFVSELKNNKFVENIEVAGSYRRHCETVGDIDILVVGKEGGKIIEHFTSLPNVSKVLSKGDTKGSIIDNELNIQIDLRVVDEKSFGSALQYFTGSKAHNIKLRGIAKDLGYKLSEYGIFKEEEYICGRDEIEVYEKLGLVFIPPELREDRGEIELALKGKIPSLVQLKDIKGDLHIHSNYSDGFDDIETIASYGISLGYEYIGIADHSMSVKYAGGLEEERILKQIEEIENLNKKLKNIKILKGSEVDILKDGSLDFKDEILKKLDFVIAAIHQGFKKNVTERMIDAMDNPYVKIIAHPTGRLLSGREGYDVNIEKVMEKASEKNIFLEINSYYDRLDLNEINAKMAKEMGIKLIINTDAHNIKMMNDIKYGVYIARRAWLNKDDIVNTRNLKDFINLLKNG
uniref:DNA polymerase beta n=1 Tax=candidate division WOR-3 bacterium TaxID=2052148 RepID=A0A7C3YNY6_UNCW3